MSFCRGISRKVHLCDGVFREFLENFTLLLRCVCSAPFAAAQKRHGVGYGSIPH